MTDQSANNMNDLIRQAAGRGAPEPEPEPDGPAPFPDLGQGARPLSPATEADSMNTALRAHLSAHRRRPLPADYL